MRGGGCRRSGRLAALARRSALPPRAGRRPPPGPLTLPETLRGTVQVPRRSGMADDARPADTLRDLYPGLAACWEVARGPRSASSAPRSPPASPCAGTASSSATPRVTFSTQPTDTRAYRILADATLAAIRRCTPGPDHARPRRGHRGAPHRAPLHLPRTQGTRSLDPWQRPRPSSSRPPRAAS